MRRAPAAAASRTLRRVTAAYLSGSSAWSPLLHAMMDVSGERRGSSTPSASGAMRPSLPMPYSRAVSNRGPAASGAHALVWMSTLGPSVLRRGGRLKPSARARSKSFVSAVRFIRFDPPVAFTTTFAGGPGNPCRNNDTIVPAAVARFHGKAARPPAGRRRPPIRGGPAGAAPRMGRGRGCMEYTRFGTTDIEVSRIALGTWAIGGWLWGGTDVKDSIRAIHEALDMGITTIDTAPVYGFGLSE